MRVLLLATLPLVLCGFQNCSSNFESSTNLDSEQPRNYPSSGLGVKPDPGTTLGTLRELGARNGIFIGSAISTAPLTDARYTSFVKSNFSMVTAEFQMKMDALQTSEGVFDFTAADQLVETARANGQLVRGHVLAWHNSIPAWVTSRSRTPAERAALLENHIRTVVTHFRDKYPGTVLVWDVVNEAIRDYWGDLRVPEGPGVDPKHVSYWAPIGNGTDDYIKLAFATAHDADPDAILYYNDYGTEEWDPTIYSFGRPSKTSGVYNLVKGLKDQGVHIDGVGLQFHVFSTHVVDTAAVIENMAQIARLGLRVQVTEFDSEAPNDADLDRQGVNYAHAAEACIRSPNCDAFVTWGFTDVFSWEPTLRKTMLDSSFQKKPGFAGLLTSLGLSR